MKIRIQWIIALFVMSLLIVAISIKAFGATSLTVTWTAPYAHNDDPASGAVASYDLRYSANPITDANFATATALTTTTPKAPGQNESYSFTIPDLNKYYLAIKSTNAEGVVSPISNIAVKDFFPPAPVANLQVGTH